MSTKTKQIIGSISHGTMREEDLIPRFLDALIDLDPERAKAIQDEHGATIDTLGSDDLTDEETESQSWLLNEVLFDALNGCAPPHFYFGAHPGDGADYGFWLSEDLNQQVEDNNGLIVSDTSEVPGDFTGEVLHVNDRGNATLYTAQCGKLSEVWSIV